MNYVNYLYPFLHKNGHMNDKKNVDIKRDISILNAYFLINFTIFITYISL